MFFVNHQIELLPWPARNPDLSPIENVVHGCSTIDLDNTPSYHIKSTLVTCGSCSRSAAPQEHIQSIFESMPRRVAAVISNNGGYSLY
ncbi:transposable element Tcb1 transposase [Trichonephila clavipes]|nr:transposable element Tcb1 transposase [Trichonephila clavipes]